MTLVNAWILHCLLLSALLTVAAVAWERSARWSGLSVRWAWLAALAGSVSLPVLLRLVPEPAWQAALPAALPVIVLDPVATAAVSAAGSSRSAADVALALWAAASLLLGLGVAGLVWQLSRLRRRWRAGIVDGVPVLVSDDVGPAAIGLTRGVIIVPAWVLSLGADLRGLLLLHEREHVRAGDPRLLLGGLLLVAAMPWNPLVWLQAARLRNAIELDCDARVLRTGASPGRYGTLLLEVGRRRRSHALVMATFAEPRMFLEERIRRIASWPARRRPALALLLGVMAVALFTSALSARGPAGGPAVLPRVLSDLAVPQVAEPADVQPADVQPADAQPTAVPPTDGAAPAVQPTAVRQPAVLPSDTPPATRRPRPLQEVADSPTFTPMTQRPELANLEEATRALQEHYPPLLRDAGIGGMATVWFLIDERGGVARTVLSATSGYEALDTAALRAAARFRFRPAYFHDQAVPVWVEIPVVFGPPPPTTRTIPPATDSVAVRMPRLLNEEEVQAAIAANYPPLLRDAGIGGNPALSLYVNRAGVVERTQITRSSGHDALDAAAMRVAAMMRFTPLPAGVDRDGVTLHLNIPFRPAPPR